MKRLGDIFDREKLKRKLARRAGKEEKLFSAWKEVMGATCASHTVHMAVRDGVLRVTLDSQAWLQDILMRDGDALAGEMTRRTGLVVARVIVRSGGRVKR